VRQHETEFLSCHAEKTLPGKKVKIPVEGKSAATEAFLGELPAV